MTCQHKMKNYVGFTDSYEYCETCGKTAKQIETQDLQDSDMFGIKAKTYEDVKPQGLNSGATIRAMNHIEPLYQGALKITGVRPGFVPMVESPEFKQKCEEIAKLSIQIARDMLVYGTAKIFVSKDKCERISPLAAEWLAPNGDFIAIPEGISVKVMSIEERITIEAYAKVLDRQEFDTLFISCKNYSDLSHNLSSKCANSSRDGVQGITMYLHGFKTVVHPTIYLGDDEFAFAQLEKL